MLVIIFGKGYFEFAIVHGRYLLGLICLRQSGMETYLSHFPSRLGYFVALATTYLLPSLLSPYHSLHLRFVCFIDRFRKGPTIRRTLLDRLHYLCWNIYIFFQFVSVSWGKRALFGWTGCVGIKGGKNRLGINRSDFSSKFSRASSVHWTITKFHPGGAISVVLTLRTRSSLRRRNQGKWVAKWSQACFARLFCFLLVSLSLEHCSGRSSASKAFQQFWMFALLQSWKTPLQMTQTELLGWARWVVSECGNELAEVSFNNGSVDIYKSLLAFPLRFQWITVLCPGKRC